MPSWVWKHQCDLLSDYTRLTLEHVQGELTWTLGLTWKCGRSNQTQNKEKYPPGKLLESFGLPHSENQNNFFHISFMFKLTLCQDVRQSGMNSKYTPCLAWSHFELTYSMTIWFILWYAYKCPFMFVMQIFLATWN